MPRPRRGGDDAIFFRPRKRRRSRRAGAQPSALEEGLALLNERLGSTPRRSRGRKKTSAARLIVKPTTRVARSIYYAPDMDGQAEPGEVVWVTVPSTPPQERSMLIVGREHHDVLGLLISPDKEHATDEHWLGIGSGEWEASGEPCWVRTDKTLMVAETDVHRRGASVPRRRFERVANRLRDRFDWI
ncbi:PemK-like, MazF-like toxin of type II toxin-antitoxin system [Corynebacterium mycetoides]|uniref:PemK-like, MazF-like toxin of type II toxin-antitoxin system n=1 Tax=Corynebacterium mycetoides TaxID=38302 RepID=A0A1G9NMY3_9CORY|nr:type II toxin-antitoxin system PemK/MazF family toxin [Corynebacterium mycetoides]SDL87946.1 PemK-like, MazF-like toxin of type II toxin-antitoxin system [Corynebacterium mycetoides]